jgi:threonine-phosphate decarboxylase
VTVTHGGNIFAISRERGWDWREVADFSASINPLGPAPGVMDAIHAALPRIVHYPEREPAHLRCKLADLWDIDPAQILLGNGATELLHWLARVERHRPVTFAVPAFSEFYRAYPGARCVDAAKPEQWPREGLLVLTQPNNPAGAIISPDLLEPWLLSTNNPVLIDESFLEFTGLSSSAYLLRRRPRLYILRSLTKFYALPGLRLGALLAASEEMSRWERDREPWQVNVLAEAAALAAIADREHARRSREFVAAERGWLSAQLSAIAGVHPVPSHANYLLVKLDYLVSPLVSHFLESKILIRDCTGNPGITSQAVRVAVRTRSENERLIARWKEFSCAH